MRQQETLAGHSTMAGRPQRRLRHRFWPVATALRSQSSLRSTTPQRSANWAIGSPEWFSHAPLRNDTATMLIAGKLKIVSLDISLYVGIGEPEAVSPPAPE